MQKFIFFAGILTGASWLILNFLLTAKLLKIALLQSSKEKLSALLLLKFPLLYLLGFLILNSRVFPSLAIVVGLGLGLMIIGISRIWPRKH